MCCAVVSVSCNLVVTCWEKADLLAVMFVVFCHFPKCVLVHNRVKGEVGALKLVSLFVCLFDLILYIHSTIFQLCGTGLPGLNQY